MDNETIASAVAYMDSKEAKIRSMGDAVGAVDEAIAKRRKARPGRRTPAESAEIEKETMAAWKRVQNFETRADVAADLGITYQCLSARFLRAGLTQRKGG